MELLQNHMNSKVFCDRITASTYEQKVVSDNPYFSSMIDLFLHRFDHHYVLVENKDKQLYIKQKIVEIATAIDEDSKNSYDRFSYLKCMNATSIQHGLQKGDTVSALLYLSDLYNVSSKVYIASTTTYVNTSDKTREPFSILFTNGKWSELTEEPPFTEGEFTCLGECVVLDVDTKDVYKKYLQPIGKYKAPELIEIAKSMNIPIETDGKKKVKKTLYDDINIYQLNLS